MPFSGCYTVGRKRSFLNAAGTVEMWEYQGGVFTTVGSWVQGGAGKLTELETKTALGIFFYEYDVSSKIPHLEILGIEKDRNFIINERLFLSYARNDKTARALQFRDSVGNIIFNYYAQQSVINSGVEKIALTSSKYKNKHLIITINWSLSGSYVFFGSDNIPFGPELNLSSIAYLQGVLSSYADMRIELNNVFIYANPKYENWLPGCIERLEVIQNKNSYRLFVQSFYKSASKVYFLIRKSNENIPGDNIIVYDSPILPSGKNVLTLSNESNGVILKLYVNYDLFPTYNKIESLFSLELNLTANFLPVEDGSGFSGNYNDLENKPAIPTATPIATSQQLGKVKPDGTTILIDEHGMLVASPQVQGSTIIIKPETKEGYRNLFPDPNFALGQWILNDNNAIWLQSSGEGQIEIVHDNNEPAIKQTIAKSGAFGLSLKIRLNPDVYKAYAKIGTKFKIGAYFKFLENESGAVKNWGFANNGLKGSVTTNPVASSTSYAIPLSDYSWKEQTFEITQVNDGIIAMGFYASCNKVGSTPVSMHIKGITFYFNPDVSETGEMKNFSSDENTQFIGDIRQIGTLLSHYIESNKGLIRNLLFDNAECQGAVLNINSYQNKNIVNKSRLLELSENYAFPSKGTYIGRKEDGVYICINGVEHKI